VQVTEDRIMRYSI